jgi:hypothetical protein
MDKETLQKKIIKIQETLIDESLADGITIQSAALTSTLLMAVEQHVLTKDDTLDVIKKMQDALHKTFNMGIKRG